MSKENNNIDEIIHDIFRVGLSGENEIYTIEITKEKMREIINQYGEVEYQRGKEEGLKAGDWNAENLQEAYELGKVSNPRH